MDVTTTSRPAAGKRREPLRWLAWFTAANAACAGLICARYLWLYDWPDDAIGIGYALLAASFGQWLSRSKHFAKGQRYFAATMFIGLGVSAALTDTK
jgi:threonine/homoserine/homoserine lactone efflux protein